MKRSDEPVPVTNEDKKSSFTPRSIFFIVYFIFHVAFLAVAIYVNYKSEDFEFLLWLRERMSLVVYVAVLGLVLFGINMLIYAMLSRSKKKELAVMDKEVNSMKAKMFDLQEATESLKSSVVETDIDDGNDTPASS